MSEIELEQEELNTANAITIDASATSVTDYTINTSGASLTYSSDGAGWTSVQSLYPTEMTYRVEEGEGEGTTVTFKGSEITRLKEMLTEWIKERHPEDLL